MNAIDLRRVDLNLLVTLSVLLEERSVSRAAERMGLTQSALSHALARLRDLMQDPLLIKSGARMTPSPRALELMDEIRPILRSLERILAAPAEFDPATSERLFRLYMPDMLVPAYARLLQHVQKLNSAIALEWVGGRAHLLLEIADGQIDAAVVPEWLKLPEGVAAQPVGAYAWACFLREGHPAATRWSATAYVEHPHVVVRVGHRQDPNPFQEKLAEAGIERRIGAWVPHFTAVAPLLAATDFIATLPRAAMIDAARAYRLVELPPPIPIEPIPHQLVWNGSRSSEPAIRWLRLAIVETLKHLT